MILSFALFLAVLTIALILDHGLFLRHRDVQHKTEWWLKAAACMPSIILLALWKGSLWWVLLSGPLFACIWYLLFDGFYNVLRGTDWWNNGAAEGKVNDSWLDRWLRTLANEVEGIVKIGLVLVLGVLFFAL